MTRAPGLPECLGDVHTRKPAADRRSSVTLIRPRPNRSVRLAATPWLQMRSGRRTNEAPHTPRCRESERLQRFSDRHSRLITGHSHRPARIVIPRMESEAPAECISPNFSLLMTTKVLLRRKEPHLIAEAYWTFLGDYCRALVGASRVDLRSRGRLLTYM